MKTLLALLFFASTSYSAQCTLVGGTDFSLCQAISQKNCGLAAKGDFMKCQSVVSKNCNLHKDFYLTCKAVTTSNCGLVAADAFNLCLAITKDSSAKK